MDARILFNSDVRVLGSVRRSSSPASDRRLRMDDPNFLTSFLPKPSMTTKPKTTESPTVKAMRSLGQRDAAWLLGITDRALRNHPDAPRGLDGRYDAQQLVSWYVAKQIPDDPLTTGPETPEMEKWRRIRRMREEVTLLQSLKELQSSAELRAVLTSVLDTVRGFAERMIVSHGNGTADDWSETRTMVDNEIARRLRLDARRRELCVWVGDEPNPVSIDLDLLGKGDIDP
jgi:hypothetical protein